MTVKSFGISVIQFSKNNGNAGRVMRITPENGGEIELVLTPVELRRLYNAAGAALDSLDIECRFRARTVGAKTLTGGGAGI